jgi:2-polyprenyl-3-methyl-5-hydroxy-6-metoxy-1,4-benzoquinol methylase
MKVKEHYDKHLGNFYSWMVGDFQGKQTEQQIFFQTHEIKSDGTSYAFDLGAGHGLQSVSLARLGFKVKAIDFNRQLLDELKTNCLSLPVEIIEDDILQFLANEKLMADVIVCMGDTLTHLETISQVERLINLASQRLISRGKLILSFRDLTAELTGAQRFIPVKHDDQRLLTCFLEYFSDHVMVHDILHEKLNHQWSQKVSAYPKLRVSADIVRVWLEKNNFEILFCENINRMVHIIASKKS